MHGCILSNPLDGYDTGGFLPLESFGSYICCGFVMFDMVYFCFVNIHNDIKEDS